MARNKAAFELLEMKSVNVAEIQNNKKQVISGWFQQVSNNS